jgi:hypothetical protein
MRVSLHTKVVLTSAAALLGVAMLPARCAASVSALPLLVYPLPAPPSPPSVGALAQRPEITRRAVVGVNAAALAAGTSVAADLFGTMFTFEHVRIESRSADRYVWIGRVRGRPDSAALFVVTNDSITGEVTLDGRAYVLQPLSAGRNTLEEVDLSLLPPEAPPLEPPPLDVWAARRSRPASPVPARLETGIDSDLDTIKILVVYTPAAAAGLADIEGAIELAIVKTNFVLENSLVNTRVALAGMALTEYVEPGPMHDDLFHLYLPDDGLMDEVHLFRDELDADVVSLISAGNNYCGIAYLLTSLEIESSVSAFNVTRYSCMSGYVFTHEFGHSVGAGHDRVTGCLGTFPYSCGYRDEAGGSWGTVMAYGCDWGNGCPSIPYFSNPDITYNAMPIGVAEEDPLAADNARTLNETALTVASFRGTSLAVSDITASTDRFDDVIVEWTPSPLQRAVGYRVSRAPAFPTGPFLEVTWDVTAPPFIDSNADVDILYDYRIATLTADGLPHAVSDPTRGMRRNINCGNGVVDAASEQCDGEPCCTPDCTFEADGEVCRPVQHACDAPEFCRGYTPECPDDALAYPGTPCGDDGNPCTDHLCDTAGSCIIVFNSSPCDDGQYCNGADYCYGGACSLHAGNPCCYPTGACDEESDSCFSTSTTTLTALDLHTTTTQPMASPSTTVTPPAVCGRPVTSVAIYTAEPAAPSASDCLYVLGAAVGLIDCNPFCICDLAHPAGVSATDALVCTRAAVAGTVDLTCSCSEAAEIRAR